MSINGLSQNAFNDLKAIASQAYGSGALQKSSGGNGYMGLIKSPEGEVRVFKCLTHRKERNEYAKNADYVSNDTAKNLESASKMLEKELMTLAKKVSENMDFDASEKFKDDIAKMIKAGKGENEAFKPLLSRKIVAAVISKIVQSAGGDVKAFWSGIKHTGTVENTSVQSNSYEFNKPAFDTTFSTNATKLQDEAFEKLENTEPPKTFDDAIDRIESGNIGNGFASMIGDIIDDVHDFMPKYVTPERDGKKPSGLNITTFDKASFTSILFDSHSDEAFSHTTMREDSPFDTKNNLVRTFFKMSMKRAVLDYKIDLYLRSIGESNNLEKRYDLILNGLTADQEKDANELMAKDAEKYRKSHGKYSSFIEYKLKLLVRKAIISTQLKTITVEANLARFNTSNTQEKEHFTQMHDLIYGKDGNPPNEWYLSNISRNVDHAFTCDIISDINQQNNILNTKGHETDVDAQLERSDLQRLKQVFNGLDFDTSDDVKGSKPDIKNNEKIIKNTESVEKLDLSNKEGHDIEIQKKIARRFSDFIQNALNKFMSKMNEDGYEPTLSPSFALNTFEIPSRN